MTPGAESAAIIPGTVMVRPAIPGLTENVLEISGRIPTGRNSVVTDANEPNARDRTASFWRTGESSLGIKFCMMKALISERKDELGYDQST
ncbi:hypothetical protein M2305_003196 [Gluconobacter cerinus]|uniref:hypothetical protein n=1 Tax=Gluconobacter cerinus TaxID=38307 RepID=UPI002227CB81|nr:hypothetical protein [Gluconobacter cerinus]MCW2267177.1 hypothetical protein [Gluconobacter cerinus]